jgi:hypothetical protein
MHLVIIRRCFGIPFQAGQSAFFIGMTDKYFRKDPASGKF